MNLFEYEKIGPEILQSYKVERKMVLLLQKFKSKECRVFVYLKKQTSMAAYIYDSIDICIHFV